LLPRPVRDPYHRPQHDRVDFALHPQVLVREHLHVHLQSRELVWRKSTASNPSGNCVELAELAGGDIAMRNSRHPGGPTLVYTRAEIAAFIDGVLGGEFDDLAGRAHAE
jgi:uncharacterized protein DUF397